MKRFPIGLTLAAAVGLAVLLGLGAWQLKRLAWKKDLLAKIAALQHAPATPIGGVLTEAAGGKDVGYVRVSAACGPPKPAPAVYRYALRDGQVGWRLLTFCPLDDAPYAGIVLDRGLVEQLSGQMSPRRLDMPAARQVIGVLRAPGKPTPLDTPPATTPDGAVVLQSIDFAALHRLAASAGAANVAPYYLAVESETPTPPGLTPAALPQDIPNNHLVYALTWFGLAGVLVWTWAGFVLRRMRQS